MLLAIIFVKDYSIIMFKLMEQVYLQTQTRIEKNHDLNVHLNWHHYNISEELNGQMKQKLFNKQMQGWTQ